MERSKIAEEGDQMIDRYWGKKMRELWSSELRKFFYWRIVEIAVLRVRESFDQIPSGTVDRIEKKTRIDAGIVAMIERRDEAIHHDLNAFIEVMRLQILLEPDEFERIAVIKHDNDGDEEFNDAMDEALKGVVANPDAGYFHDAMTSYDTEEPAMTLLLRDSCAQIFEELNRLIDVTTERAKMHKGLLMVGRTHGQHAQPITFGIKCVNWLDMLVRAKANLERLMDEALVMKLSGAVGVFGTLGPEIEEAVGDVLKLRPVVATQILPIDRRARIISELGITSGIIEKIAFDLWLMHQTEVGEVIEPFKPRQKGSSAMPHKKNPVLIENTMGCAAIIRGYVSAEQELIKTAHERDIAHSAPERLILVDAFGMMDHQIRRMTKIISKMTIIPERMAANLEMTKGTIASQRLEMLLKQKGMTAEVAYRTVQDACFAVRDTGEHLKVVILENQEAAPLLEHDPEFEACFDWVTWVENEDDIYQRAGVVA